MRNLGAELIQRGGSVNWRLSKSSPRSRLDLDGFFKEEKQFSAESPSRGHGRLYTWISLK